MRIDIHTHVGPFADVDSTPQLLAEYLSAAQIDVALVSNRAAASAPAGALNLDEAEANEICLRVCATDARLLPLYWARPGARDSSPTTMLGALRAAPFRGAVFSPALNGFAADDRRVDPYLAALEETGKPALFHVGTEPHAAPELVLAIARRHPQLPIVIYGAGQFSQRKRIIELIRETTVRQDARLSFDTAQADADELVHAVRALGAGAVLFGTDAVCHGERHAPRCAALLSELAARLSPDEFDTITRRNAQRLFEIAPRPEHEHHEPGTDI